MTWRRTLLALLLTLSPLGGLRAQENVSFPSLDTPLTDAPPTTLSGRLFRPPGDGTFPAIVGLHGCGGLFDKSGALQGREAAWAATLTQRGYVVLFVDSFGPRGEKGGCAAGAPKITPWDERSYDVYGALRYLQGLPYVIGKRIGLMGWSHGGATTMFAISRETEARPRDLPQGDFRAAVAFYPGWCNKRDLGDDWTTAIPLLLEMGAADDWTVARDCVPVVEDAGKHGAPVTIKLYDGAYHDFDWPDDPVHTLALQHGRFTRSVHLGLNDAARADALMRVPAFFDRYLKP